ncbi:hypothetical protein HDF14_002802 [Edaphobacter lichenicola]|jgi:hypothetical protein|uniref:Uncharacterized protein n=1 Tax=Tunturiibacter gelidiferens TaxID=3069689 RepID=A0A9X0QEY7_9BACT|nr:hypothetical protein [Edaphobacter lichenicola]
MISVVNAINHVTLAVQDLDSVPMADPSRVY